MGTLRAIGVQSFSLSGWIDDTTTVVLVCTPWPYPTPPHFSSTSPSTPTQDKERRLRRRPPVLSSSSRCRKMEEGMYMGVGDVEEGGRPWSRRRDRSGGAMQPGAKGRVPERIRGLFEEGKTPPPRVYTSLISRPDRLERASAVRRVGVVLRRTLLTDRTLPIECVHGDFLGGGPGGCMFRRNGRVNLRDDRTTEAPIDGSRMARGGGEGGGKVKGGLLACLISSWQGSVRGPGRWRTGTTAVGPAR